MQKQLEGIFNGAKNPSALPIADTHQEFSQLMQIIYRLQETEPLFKGFSVGSSSGGNRSSHPSSVIFQLNDECCRVLFQPGAGIYFSTGNNRFIEAPLTGERCTGFDHARHQVGAWLKEHAPVQLELIEKAAKAVPAAKVRKLEA